FFRGERRAKALEAPYAFVGDRVDARLGARGNQREEIVELLHLQGGQGEGELRRAPVVELGDEVLEPRAFGQAKRRLQGRVESIAARLADQRARAETRPFTMVAGPEIESESR